MSKFEVRDTKKYGKGVFSVRNIKKGEVIFVLGGIRKDVYQAFKDILDGKENLDDVFQIGMRTYLDLNELSRTFNHSCNPNGGIRKNSELFALRDINKGEELTYDYSLTIAPTEWSMKCKCGSKICRKTLGDISTIPKGRLAYYKKMGAIQRYMKNILPAIESKKYNLPTYEKKMLAWFS